VLAVESALEAAAEHEAEVATLARKGENEGEDEVGWLFARELRSEAITSARKSRVGAGTGMWWLMSTRNYRRPQVSSALVSLWPIRFAINFFSLWPGRGPWDAWGS